MAITQISATQIAATSDGANIQIRFTDQNSNVLVPGDRWFVAATYDAPTAIAAVSMQLAAAPPVVSVMSQSAPAVVLTAAQIAAQIAAEAAQGQH